MPRDDEDERPRRRPRRQDEDDEDDRPRRRARRQDEDDEEDERRPRRRARWDDDDLDDEDDGRPRRRKKKSSSAVALLLTAGILDMISAAPAAVGGLFWIVVSIRSFAHRQPLIGVAPPIWVVVIMLLMALANLVGAIALGAGGLMLVLRRSLGRMYALGGVTALLVLAFIVLVCQYALMHNFTTNMILWFVYLIGLTTFNYVVLFLPNVTKRLD